QPSWVHLREGCIPGRSRAGRARASLQGRTCGVPGMHPSRRCTQDAPTNEGTMAQGSPYRRILLKLGGEALLGSEQYGSDPAVIRRVAQEVAEVIGLGVQVGLVTGGGNIFRGAGLAEAGMDRVTADHMGMLATVINSLAMQDALERQ